MPLGTEVRLGPGDFVFGGDPATPEKRAHPPPPKFGPCLFICIQTAGWIKTPLGTEVDLGPCDFVLDGDPASPEKRSQPPPNFWPMSIVAKRLGGSRYAS